MGVIVIIAGFAAVIWFGAKMKNEGYSAQAQMGVMLVGFIASLLVGSLFFRR